jgi:predicted ribosome quality control (RQC) complex YloA/Tae2 family protein
LINSPFCGIIILLKFKEIFAMAFDGIVTKAVVSELNTCLINGKINKIFEPNKNEILLGVYSSGKNYCLNVSIDSVNYRVNLTTNSKPNPQNVLNFCMVLRKHLTGGTIKRIYSNGLERIVFIDIDVYNELNDLITKTLVVELMGKHSNIILLNSEHTVIDSLRHLNKFDNSNRDIFPGSKYLNIESAKKDFLAVKTFDEFYRDVSIDSENLPSTLSKVYNGFGKKNVSYLLETLNIPTAVSTNNLKEVYSYLKDLFANMPDNVVLKEYSSVKKDYFAYKSTNDGLAANFYLDDFYTSKEQSEQFKQYRDTVLKLVLNHVGKIKERISTIDLKIADCTNAEKYRLYGELITSNLYRIPDYPQSEVTLENYYDNNNLITIPLDEKFSPSKNAKNFFKKYRKLQNTIAIVEKQKELSEAELSYLESIVYELEEVSTIEDIDNIYSEICDNLIFGKNANTVNNHVYNKQSKITNSKSSKQSNASNMPEKRNIDGYTVYIGKNNKQNDYLTCRLAQNSDIWFHTKDIHGSHVVLKTDSLHSSSENSSASCTFNIPDSVLYKCASIAAYYSKARMSQNVPVDYTLIKYVKKPNGAKPGMVIYTNNKTIYANPQNIQ